MQELSPQPRDGSEYSSRDDIALDLAETELDLIQPGRVGRSEQGEVGVYLHRGGLQSVPLAKPDGQSMTHALDELAR